MGSSKTITLPRDAEGREIPLNTKKIYDEMGNERRVMHIEYDPYGREWGFIVSQGVSSGFLSTRYAHLEKPAPPDSWEKLLEDLDNASKGGDVAECLYMRRDGMEVQCPGCRLEDDESDDIECSYLVFADIAARIRKLRGDGE